MGTTVNKWKGSVRIPSWPWCNQPSAVALVSRDWTQSPDHIWTWS